MHLLSACLFMLRHEVEDPVELTISIVLNGQSKQNAPGDRCDVRRLSGNSCRFFSPSPTFGSEHGHGRPVVRIFVFCFVPFNVHTCCAITMHLLPIALFFVALFAADAQMTWRACEDTPAQSISTTSVTLVPDPPVIGGSATFTVDAVSCECMGRHARKALMPTRCVEKPYLAM